jgi:hypothetical protein
MTAQQWPAFGESYTYQGPQQWEYKVLELRESRFRGTFSPRMLMDMLVPEGHQGWQCVGVVEVDKIAGGGKNREGILIVLQRPGRPMR